MIFSVNPRTEEKIYEFNESSLADILDAFRRAHNAQKEWYEKTTKDDRIDLILNLIKTAQDRKSEIVDLMYSETGIPKKSLSAAYGAALSGTDYYINRYLYFNSENIPVPEKWADTSASVEFVPHGTIAHIGIWNFPFWQTMISAIPALLTGNSIIYKPSEFCTATGLAVADLIHSSGFPEDMYIPLIGGKNVGEAMVASPCDAVLFTGGINTGQSIIKNAGVKPLILELSGNDAAVVCSDADVEQAARGIATGTFSRGGQVCIRVKRVYVHEDIAEEFIEKLTKIATHLDLYDDVGPLISQEARLRVSSAVDDAVGQGAELLCGGQAISPGYFYEPTIFTHSDDTLRAVKEETFGPVCPVRTVHSDDEAVKLANNSAYGLGASVWTQDTDKMKRMADALEAGNIWINDCGSTLPGGEYFQGWKNSGIPSSMSRLELFLKKKTIICHNSNKCRPKWYS